MSTDGEANNAVEGNPVRQVFAPLAAEGYVFSTARGAGLNWILQRLWLVSLILLVAQVAATFMVLRAADDAVILEAGDYLFSARYVNGALTLDPNHGWDESARLVPDGRGWIAIESERTGERLEVVDLTESTDVAETMARELVIYVLPFFLLLILMSWLFGRFARAAPRILAELAWAGRLKPGPERAEPIRGIGPFGWRSYVADLEQALHGRWRLTMLAGLLAIASVAVFLLSSQRGSLDILVFGHIPSSMMPFVAWEALILAVSPLVVVFFSSHALWLLVVVGTYIRRLTDVFDLDIQLGHGDHCGGLKRLGDICLQLTLITLLPAVGLGAWVLTGIVGRSIPAVGIAVYLVLAILAVMATITFILPVWRVHTEMVRARLAFQDRAAAAIAPVEERLRMLLAQGRLEDDETDRLERQLERLRQLYPADLKTFTWPFDLSVLAAFSSSLLVPALSLVIQFDEAVEAVKSIGGRFGLGG